MPELPEVETTVRGLRSKIRGLVVRDVWTDLHTKDKRKKDSVSNPRYFKLFKKEVRGGKVLSVERRAKNILINLSNKKTILIHMKMTGHLLYGKYKSEKNTWRPIDKISPLHDPYNRFIHVVFLFSNKKSLAFSDARKFGKITLLESNAAHRSKHLDKIGPEPLEESFDFEEFKSRLSGKPGGEIKTVLMDQSVLAGIGNIYSDEILWRAGVHPERKVSNIKEKELKLIFRATKETLSKGIDLGGDSMSDYRNIDGSPGKFQLHHEAYRRTGEKCRKKGCGGTIQRKIINSRSAHFCSTHQK